MQKMGFSHRWIDWTMTCGTSVRYTLKLNGTSLDSFAPSLGLRQGDPLSPFLFLFIADGISAILRNRVNSGIILPVKICRRAPGISHLLFADDTLLFFEANCVQAERIKSCLNLYARATSQFLNYNKCSIMFGEACPTNLQEEVRDILNIQNASFEEKYLGLPTPNGRMSKGKFQNLQAQLLKRLVQWGDGHLAQPGREVLIKSVAQALPTYIMGVFKLPFSVCDDLTNMTRNFYWGSSEGKRKVHWKAWQKLQQPKCKGGAGFRDFRIFNQALLARQAWRLLTKPDSLCAQILKARYYPNGKLEDTVFAGNTSSTWTAISHGLDLLKKGLIWRVGNGQQIRIWRDSWIPRPFSYKPISPQGTCRFRFVSQLLNNNGSWNVNLLQSIFLPCDVTEILKIRASPRLGDDVLAWGPGRLGAFSVKICLQHGF